MEASRFDGLFVRHVVGPAERAGFARWGKGLWFERQGLRAALLRTELRYIWPFAFTLVVGHDCLRDFDDRLPAPRSRNPSEWPVKLRPSLARDLVDGWTYLPWNTGRWPADTMEDKVVAEQLAAIGDALAASFPEVIEHLTPAAVVQQLRRNGDSAWCERRWIADYVAAEGAH